MPLLLLPPPKYCKCSCIPDRRNKTLINVFITSHLDSLYALHFCLPDNLLHKLQVIQNNSVRIVSHKKIILQKQTAKLLYFYIYLFLPVSIEIYTVICILINYEIKVIPVIQITTIVIKHLLGYSEGRMSQDTQKQVTNQTRSAVLHLNVLDLIQPYLFNTN